MMSCQETTRAIASELADAGWRQRLSVRLHLLMCRHCRRYAAQLSAIGAAARQVFGEEPSPPDDLEGAILKRCLEGCREPDDADVDR